MTKKKHYIKTVEDIKYCEENEIPIHMEASLLYCYKFLRGVWCWVNLPTGELVEYNCLLDAHNDDLYYYEEESEEQTEATEKDIGKLCWFKSKTEIHYKVSILKKIVHYKEFNMYETEWGDRFGCCRRLTPSEVAEITGYGVTEDGNTFYGEPFKVALSCWKEKEE